MTFKVTEDLGKGDKCVFVCGSEGEYLVGELDGLVMFLRTEECERL